MKVVTRLNSILFLTLIFMASCSNDDEQVTLPKKLDAKFEVVVNGDAPNASITILNHSSAATNYEWTFGEGASISTSNEKSPTLTVEKAGGLEVTLKTSNASGEKTTIKTVVIPGHSPILTFTDIEFSILGGDATYGRFFSTETGLIYKNYEVTADNGSKIDIAFDSFSGFINFFETPTKAKYNIPNASISTFINSVTSEFDTTNFENMSHDELIANLDLSGVTGTFPDTYKGVVIFENSHTKKGVIKVKNIDSKRVLVDIKIQKY